MPRRVHVRRVRRVHVRRILLCFTINGRSLRAQGSDLAAEPRAVAGARASDFGLRQCVGWRHRHQRDSP